MSDDTMKLSTSDQKALPADESPQLDDGSQAVSAALEEGRAGDSLRGSVASSTAISSTDADDEAAASDQVAETLAALQGVIERNAEHLDEIKAELKLQRESLRSVFENDSELSAAQEQAQTFTSQVKDRKSKLAGDATVVQLRNKVAELTEQKKEIEEALSNHLVNYFQLTNSKSIDTADGDQREFVIQARIRGRK